MKTPRGFIVWQRSGMKRAILYLARSFRRPPTNTPANHTKHSRRLTTNLVNYVTSSLNKLTLDPIPPIASVNDARVTISTVLTMVWQGSVAAPMPINSASVRRCASEPLLGPTVASQALV